MNFQELTDLIAIRNYVSNTINNTNSIDRATVSELSGTLILLDKKILNIIKGTDFKSFINYQDVKQAIKEVVDLNNIRSGLKK